MTASISDKIKWDDAGLVPAIAQDATSGEVLMMAWMNAESLQLTIDTGHAVYWSRSRGKLWHKGEESGNQQVVQSIRLDCDNDVLLLKVEQKGGVACHTGRARCFYKKWSDGAWQTTEAVLKDPKEMYKSKG